MSRRPSQSLSVRISALAAGMLLSGVALADAHLDSDLLARMAAAGAADELAVVVSYDHSGPVTASQIAGMKAVGIESGIVMRALPIAGALATPAEIRALARRDDVVSIVYNAPVEYYNKEQRDISGATRVVDNQGDFGRAIPYSGAGVTVVVNDSGIDATHDDLKFGRHVVQNVLAPQNVAANIAKSAAGFQQITYVEGVHNTDLGSGHGTHCAGTIGGTGARSNGLYRGVAPGAQLVGYGSGGVTFILDALGGLDYALQNQFSFGAPVRVVSNSWGTSGPYNEKHAISIATYELYKKGIVSVFAAGNSGSGENTHNPYAQSPWVISVGAGEKNGILTSFSSRGNRGESRTFTMPDGKSWTYFNLPTIVATGVNIISTRTGTQAPTAASADAAAIAPAQLPFYTIKSGTSMATPHTAGVVALMLEANPNLTPAQVKDILERTATNMTGRLAWEAGAGHLNAYAATMEASRVRLGYGATVNTLRPFNSNAVLLPALAPIPFAVDFAPVGTVTEQSFQVGADAAFVSANATIGSNTLALVLTDPDGIRYGSAIAAPVIASTTVGVGAPAKVGTWKITVRGIGAVAGTNLDPARVTNGVGAPGRVNGTISILRSGGYTGLNDIAGHGARQAIQFAVANRLADGDADGNFRPDAVLTRGELAQYLVMGASIRQALPATGTYSFADVPAGDARFGYIESVAAAGAPLRDRTQRHAGVMAGTGGSFLPDAGVTKVSLAYSLVQSMGLQAQAAAFTGPLTAFFDGKRVPVTDADAIPAPLRGYVQLALDRGLLNARFSVQQGPFDTAPTLSAQFLPNEQVTRAAFAVAASRYQPAYLTGL